MPRLRQVRRGFPSTGATMTLMQSMRHRRFPRILRIWMTKRRDVLSKCSGLSELCEMPSGILVIWVQRFPCLSAEFLIRMITRFLGENSFLMVRCYSNADAVVSISHQMLVEEGGVKLVLE